MLQTRVEGGVNVGVWWKRSGLERGRISITVSNIELQTTIQTDAKNITRLDLLRFSSYPYAFLESDMEIERRATR